MLARKLRFLLSAVLSLCWASPTSAGWAAEGTPTANPPTSRARVERPGLARPAVERPAPSPLWIDGIGSGLRRGTRHAALTLGPGIGTRALGSKQRHDLSLTALQFGWVFSEVIGKGRWYQGNAELVSELFGGVQNRPDDHLVVGVVPMLRYTFAPGGRWVPFVSGGVGLAYTTINDPDLGGKLQFTVQVGAGVHYFTSADRALTLQYRWFHLSNAGIREPNSGLNTHLAFAGVSWLF